MGRKSTKDTRNAWVKTLEDAAGPVSLWDALNPNKKWSTDYPCFDGVETSLGNHKLPGRKDKHPTLTINMGPAVECPSEKQGRCMVVNLAKLLGLTGNPCYAQDPEKNLRGRYVLPMRIRQKIAWLTYSPERLLGAMRYIVKRLRKAGVKVKYLRFNESGEFWGQDCVRKLDFISKELKAEFGIITYGYSARDDLDFTGVSFRVMGSGKKLQGGHGETCVVPDSASVPEGYMLCPADCRHCSLCKTSAYTKVAFMLHGSRFNLRKLVAYLKAA